LLLDGLRGGASDEFFGASASLIERCARHTLGLVASLNVRWNFVDASESYRVRIVGLFLRTQNALSEFSSFRLCDRERRIVLVLS
jgi:hypothetical protein